MRLVLGMAVMVEKPVVVSIFRLTRSKMKRSAASPMYILSGAAWMNSIGRMVTPNTKWIMKNTLYDQRRIGAIAVVSIVVKHKNTNHPAITTGEVRRSLSLPN